MINWWGKLYLLTIGCCRERKNKNNMKKKNIMHVCLCVSLHVWIELSLLTTYTDGTSAKRNVLTVVHINLHQTQTKCNRDRRKCEIFPRTTHYMNQAFWLFDALIVSFNVILYEQHIEIIFKKNMCKITLNAKRSRIGI